MQGPGVQTGTVSEGLTKCEAASSPASSTTSSASPGVSPPIKSSNSTPIVGPSPELDTSQQDESSDDLVLYIPVGVLGKSLAQKGRFPESEISTLEKHNWIRTRSHNDGDYVRVYVLPDDLARSLIPRSSTKLRHALKVIMSRIDRSSEAWEGRSPLHSAELGIKDSTEDESLWYIFNTLQDPNPRLEAMKETHSQQAMEDLLAETIPPTVMGLKTILYTYQRRSAATMVQREAQPFQTLDPRLQAWRSPTGLEYYYDKEDGSIVREPRLYSEACGGILAETMGCGKTLICLAVILATRGHFPKVPIQYQDHGFHPVRDKTGSLVDMAAAAAGRLSLPWKRHFETLKQQGVFFDRCVKACELHCGSYEIPPHQTRYQGRHSTSYPRPPAKRIRLCTGTLVVVPPNLVDHWEREITTHTEGLKVLVLRSGSDVTPPASQLLEFDIVLFSKTRFEREAGEVINNRRHTFIQVNSPLTELHWLRVIVDEGHGVAGSGSKTNMMHMLNQLHIERRWIISGTPSTGLYGVEISLASQEVNTSDTESADAEDLTVAALQVRKKTGNAVENELKDLDRLRRIVIEFLDLKPWSNSRADDPADWTRYIKPIGPDGKRRKSTSLRATLQSLVVRHRLRTINSEMTLPKLYNRVVYLEPTFHDKLSINLFLFGLAVNSITSERQGPDYMFSKSNRNHLTQTINNLRQAGFWWAGSDVNVQDTVEHAVKYLNKKNDKQEPIAREDVGKLMHGIEIARRAMNSGSWHAFKQLHELGIFVEKFPDHSRALWALDSDRAHQEPMLIGITQARHAQQFVAQHLRSNDPAEGLAGAGIKVRRDLEKRDNVTRKGKPESADAAETQGTLTQSSKPQNSKTPKKTFENNIFRELPENSPLKQTRLLATASAKLTYLLDQVVKLQDTEKIIIFYDNHNSAYWIAEGLELLGVEFRIYASTLKPELRTEYLKLFRESEKVRVLLMDLRQASHGLHIAQASRVFIVNPIWQPTIESQAIKRAHRIGQTRPVYVETLVLRDTLEDRMLRRRKEMSEAEMQQAEKNLLDDNTMSDIIQKESFLSLSDEASTAAAYLKHPTGFFDRHRLPIPDDEAHLVKRTLKRPHPAPMESDADRAPQKRPNISFAENVEVVESAPLVSSSCPSPVPPPTTEPDNSRKVVSFSVTDLDADRSVDSSSPISVGEVNSLKRRVSLFGP
ncbi:hypothetical protein N7510_008428 [Penicillium lagena]|uniref:uncharacterized protein n=1 Tax=Penicillium lagena TaxID=94218 RepID=UPI0025421C77|nr:uncharacterized protein N7510_008428 [Penicillium lagena]KAJ5605647.1 hypothetical protein N7510_008428 [Penicillium lagena]